MEQKITSDNTKKVVLDLCGGSGNWSAPYRDSMLKEYVVIVVDPAAEDKLGLGNFPWTVKQFIGHYQNMRFPVHGILAAPPCTEFAASGASHWKRKEREEPHKLRNAIRVVQECLELVIMAKPQWWALENPVGRLAQCVPELGRYTMLYNPWEFGDVYAKKTCVWGKFNIPQRTHKDHPVEEKMLYHIPPSKDRAARRSRTPEGFARAFYQANP